MIVNANMQKAVFARMDLDRPDLQIKAFQSAHHEGFYIVTAFGFPCFIHVRHLDRWFGAHNDMINPHMWNNLRPHGAKDLQMVAPEVLTDIYRRGIAGLVKHRILGKLT